MLSDLTITVSDNTTVSARLLRPPGADTLLVLGHGAGAGMDHPFMAALAEQLARERVATLRYNFPYMEAGRRRPDFPNRLLATVRAAAAAAACQEPRLTLVAGGKSMGGRMTSTAASKAPLTNVSGLIFFGFPLHPAGQPAVERAQHLSEVGLPMLFVQGSRDRLASLELLEPICRKLRPPPQLHVIEGADHSFAVLKRLNRSPAEIMAELATATRDWVDRLG